MRQVQRFGLAAAAVWGAVLMGLVVAPPASARKFQMSGSWFVRNGQVFIPLQFAATVKEMTHTGGSGAGAMTATLVHVSMGNLTGAFFFPNGPVPGSGGVSANGSAPATLMLPKHRFLSNPHTVIPLMGTRQVQITTNFGVDAPFESVTLAKSGGPGSFTWCPKDAACTGGQVGGAPFTPKLRATDPPQGAGSRGGRIIYVKGANQFGGVMQMGLLRGGVIHARVANNNTRLLIVYFGGSGPTVRNLAPGGLGSSDNPATEMVWLARGPITKPTMYPMTGSLNKYPGPKVTTMGGLTNTAAGPTLFAPIRGTGPNGTLAGQFTSNYGFAHSTGTVVGQQTQGGTAAGQDFFTFMGKDNRTALGAGNLQTIAGGISFRNVFDKVGNPITVPYVSFHKVNVTMGAPIPSMSPAGFAAAGALMLLGVGYALRRRLK